MQLSSLLAYLCVFGCYVAGLHAASLYDAGLVPMPALPPQFGESGRLMPFGAPSSRIVNGQDAAVGQFPYQILLRSTAGVVCGGSIISKNYVLTAAHCVSGTTPPSGYFVLAGTITFDVASTIVGVSQIIPHPDYANFANDIALLKLSSSLTFSSTIQAIPLQTTELPNGAPVTVSGWGGLWTGGPIPTTLQYTTLYALNNDECSRRIGNAPAVLLCLEHSQGNGACSGDSGGPAAYNGYLAGVASFVINGCASTFPDGYGKVSALRAWIIQNSDV